MTINGLITIILCFSGIYLIFKVLRIYYFYKVTLKKWTVVNGEIIESKIEYFRSEIDSDTEGWKRKIIYSYTVNKKLYVSDKITKNINILLPFKDNLKNELNYIKGQKIEVYYNNKNPDESIIEGKFGYSNFLVFVLGLISLCISITKFINERG